MVWSAPCTVPPGLRLNHPEVRHIAALYWPVALGLVITQGQVALDSNLQWITGDKSRAALALATRLIQLPLGIVATAMSLASLPTLSTQQGAAFRATLARGLNLVGILIVPAVVGLFSWDAVHRAGFSAWQLPPGCHGAHGAGPALLSARARRRGPGSVVAVCFLCAP